MLTPTELCNLKETYSYKAYYIEVEDAWECVGEIVFAKSEKEAKKLVWKLDGDYDEVTSCIRKPEYDKFVDLGYIPLKEKFEDGWSGINCDWCDREISEYAIEEYKDELKEYMTLSKEDKANWEGEYYYPDSEPYNPQFKGIDTAFCCTNCLNNWHESRDKLVYFKLNTQDMLLNKYPDCTIKYSGGNFRDQTVSFDLTVPGLKYKITYESKHPDTMLVSNCDIEAWKEYKALKQKIL